MGQILSIYWKNGADWIQSLQTMRGRGTQKQCHFAGSPLFWRGYWPWQKDDAEFALINVKVPLKSGCRVFFFPVAALSLLEKPIGLFTEWYLILYPSRPGLLYTSLAFVKAVWSQFFIVYVATVYWHFSDSSLIRLLWMYTVLLHCK